MAAGHSSGAASERLAEASPTPPSSLSAGSSADFTLSSVLASTDGTPGRRLDPGDGGRTDIFWDDS